MRSDLHGAVLHDDGIPGWVALEYYGPEGGAPGWWQAVVTPVAPGHYGCGTIMFPDGSTTGFRAETFPIRCGAFSAITLIFPDDAGVGAEVTRRMLALAA